MGLDIDFLKKIALDIYEAVNPLLGTEEAGIKSKRGAGGDISMKIDEIAEKIVIDNLEEKDVNLLLISEEIGEKYIGEKGEAIENQNIIIIDPIDGSNNAVRGIPYCSVSIAYAIGKSVQDIIMAVVLDLNTKDIYWAIKNEGAYLNDKKIKVSDLDIKDNCFFELNLPTRNIFDHVDKLRPVIKRFYRFRVLGSSALTLYQVAKGSMDVFINLRDSNRLVDVAAGFLILKEAGGVMMALDGTEINGNLSIDLRFPFIASNLKLVPFLKEELISKYQSKN